MLNAQRPVPNQKSPGNCRGFSIAQSFRSLNDVNSPERLEPVVHVLVDLVLGEAVALLQLAFELFAASFDHVEIVIGEFAPLLLGGALELLPVAFNPVPIHRHLLLSCEMTINGNPRRTFLSEPRHRDVTQPAAFASRRRAVRM